MASNMVKCHLCNLVVSEVLAFIQNKLKVMDEESLIRICNTAFSSEEIFAAKKLLFDAVSTKRMKVRKSNDKSVKDLDDIIDLLKHTDATDPERIPIFVARELHRLPPVTFDHLDVTRLLRDLNALREDLGEIKNEYVTQKQLREILDTSRDPIQPPLDTINKKRGAFIGRNSYDCDSGPVGLLYVSDRSLNSVKCNLSEECDKISLSPSTRKINNETSVQFQSQDVDLAEVTTATSAIHLASECAVICSKPIDSDVSVEYTVPAIKTKTVKTMADVVRATGENKQSLGISDDEWITVQRKKPLSKNRFISKAGCASYDQKFRAAAVNKIPLYVSNVCISTSENDIKEYIWNKTNESVVLEKINCKKKRGYNSFKLFVSRNKLPMFMNSAIWPKDIYFRRFILFKNKGRQGSESSYYSTQSTS